MLTLERHTPVAYGAAFGPHPLPGSADAVAGNLAEALMDAIECGLIACGAGGQMLHANRSARREIGPGRALHLTGLRLQASSESDAELQSAIQDAACRGRRRLFWVGEGEQRLMLATIPVGGPEGSAWPAALVILGRRSLCSPVALEMLARRHALTAAETRVLGGLLGSRTALQVAQDNRVKVSTVRTQIQSIREKFGARSVDDLLLRVAQVPPMASRLN